MTRRSMMGMIGVAIGPPARRLASTQRRPNFSGCWALDPARCETPAGLPEAITQDIEHKEPVLKFSTSLRDTRIPVYLAGITAPRFQITTDGAENINRMGPLEHKSRSLWQGNKLLTTWTLATPQDPPHGKWVRYLSEDGKTQVIEIEFRSQMSNADAKLVFVRKE